MKSAEQLREAEAFLHENIPLTRAMGLRVVADQVHGFALEAPVALNYNHLRTAFGGSINAVATLAGYAFLWLELREAVAHVVVSESTIRFRKPICEMIRAICEEPEAGALKEFKSQLQQKGKARIKLCVRVEEEGSEAAELEGIFVALKNEGAQSLQPHSESPANHQRRTP